MNEMKWRTAALRTICEDTLQRYHQQEQRLPMRCVVPNACYFCHYGAAGAQLGELSVKCMHIQGVRALAEIRRADGDEFQARPRLGFKRGRNFTNLTRLPKFGTFFSPCSAVLACLFFAAGPDIMKNTEHAYTPTPLPDTVVLRYLVFVEPRNR
jgi:hypothetical protein